jgi:signal transduction histidine kinase
MPLGRLGVAPGPVRVPAGLARPAGTGEHGGVTAAGTSAAAPGRERWVPVARRWVLRAAPAVIAVAATVLVVFSWLDRRAPVSTWWVGNLTIAVGLGGMGTLLARRVPENPIGWLMLLAGTTQSVFGAGREWAVYATAVRPGGLPAPAWAAWVGTWPSMVSIGTLPLVLVVFPDGRLPSRRWRALPWVVGVAVALGCASQALVAGPFTEELPSLLNPVGVDWGGLDLLSNLTRTVLMLAIVPAVGSLVARWWGSSGELRQQLKWITFAGTLLGLELVLELAPVPYRYGDLLGWTGPLLLAFFLASITAAVLRFRLWDIDALISHSIVYGALTLGLGGAYVAVVAASGRVRDHPVEIGSSLVAAAVVAVAFAPLRDWLQRRLDRRLYGDRSDPYRALTRLGDRLGDPAPDDAVLDEVVEAIAASLRLDAVALVLPDLGTVAATGTARTAVYTVPLVFRSTPVGSLVVAHRPGAPLGRRERSVLESLAPPTAAVVHAVAATRALQRSRRALVTAREEERRRVRRDLHDGLGPALAAVRMKLDGARLLIDGDPQAAKAVLDRLTDEVRGTIADIRRLVHDLQPAALAEIGLVPAIVEQAAAFTGVVGEGGYLQVDVDAPAGIVGLPAAVEVAAYRIVGESLNNVVRHARASRCRVTLVADDPTALDVVVEDDGVGFTAEGRDGMGLASMAERAAELGGSCRVGRSALGGARIAVHLPVTAPPAPPAGSLVPAPAPPAVPADPVGAGLAPPADPVVT